MNDNEELQERLLAAWHTYKFRLIGVVLMIASAIAGLSYQSLSAEQAAAAAGERLFAVIKAAAAGEREQAAAALSQIDSEDFPELHNLALFALAAAHDKAKDAPAAIAAIREVIVHETDSGIKMMAALRLAELLINDSQTEAALAALAEHSPEGGFMRLLFAERRGDAYYAAGQNQKARQEYEQAREYAAVNLSSYTPILNIKIGAVLSRRATDGDNAAESTEAATEATTEAADEATTEAATEATTEAADDSADESGY